MSFVICRKLPISHENECKVDSPERRTAMPNSDYAYCTLDKSHLGNHHIHRCKTRECYFVWTKEGRIIFNAGKKVIL